MLLRRVICDNVCSKTYEVFVCSNACRLKRYFSDDGETQLMDKMPTDTEKKRGGFAQAFERYTSPPDLKPQTPEKEETFASLLRNSKFIDVRILCNNKACTSTVKF
jgi:hypothetical protein